MRLTDEEILGMKPEEWAKLGKDKLDPDLDLHEIAAATRGEVWGRRVAAPDRGCNPSDRSLWVAVTKSGLKSNNLKYVDECLKAYRQRKANGQDRQTENFTSSEKAETPTIQVQAGILHELATEAEAALKLRLPVAGRVILSMSSAR